MLDFSSVRPASEGERATVELRTAEDPTGAPARVSWACREGQTLHVAKDPSLDGLWYTDRPLLPGAWLLRIRAEGFLPFETGVALRAGEQARVPVPLQRE